jgi:hypothetical protein
MVSFDVAQDREPVERPFHDLWIDGGETSQVCAKEFVPPPTTAILTILLGYGCTIESSGNSRKLIGHLVL